MSSPGFSLAGKLGLLVRRLLAAPGAELVQFYLALHRLFVPGGVIIPPLAGAAAQTDKLVHAFCFGHA